MGLEREVSAVLSEVLESVASAVASALSSTFEQGSSFALEGVKHSISEDGREEEEEGEEEEVVVLEESETVLSEVAIESSEAGAHTGDIERQPSIGRKSEHGGESARPHRSTRLFCLEKALSKHSDATAKRKALLSWHNMARVKSQQRRRAEVWYARKAKRVCFARWRQSFTRSRTEEVTQTFLNKYCTRASRCLSSSPCATLSSRQKLASAVGMEKLSKISHRLHVMMMDSMSEGLEKLSRMSCLRMCFHYLRLNAMYSVLERKKSSEATLKESLAHVENLKKSYSEQMIAAACSRRNAGTLRYVFEKWSQQAGIEPAKRSKAADEYSALTLVKKISSVLRELVEDRARAIVREHAETRGINVDVMPVQKKSMGVQVSLKQSTTGRSNNDAARNDGYSSQSEVSVNEKKAERGKTTTGSTTSRRPPAAIASKQGGGGRPSKRKTINKSDVALQTSFTNERAFFSTERGMESDQSSLQHCGSDQVASRPTNPPLDTHEHERASMSSVGRTSILGNSATPSSISMSVSSATPTMPQAFLEAAMSGRKSLQSEEHFFVALYHFSTLFETITFR
uniref:Uncharacterized protein n=1 Tax=Palpitomonas bilix TaxID=652834 RepID=A0A7S3GCR9_9EUKA|mmetsp:Transcript_43711/g.113961  ORF Transcript_43711/g.113961 Transcript_43711/m.113961 type:complete len:571 (+) Transcript_43711:372-2084(+)|eukprot:CAMPEP_0113895642 /NCGR_PEP_ID=MMETSP0780_2-20120614/17492_1 /TAXON_ID=652834 /ORGANISM="Palpitomonas bilix" /LENGTH=570 /DNA_ID=CAMNT_0000886527 /DNA_START=327 /DNA_END=2039 /DNA_ORIENTATION=+ /assembly_acc=CAM_ASM_000599